MSPVRFAPALGPERSGHLDTCSTETLAAWAARHGCEVPPNSIAEYKLRRCDDDCPVLKRAVGVGVELARHYGPS